MRNTTKRFHELLSRFTFILLIILHQDKILVRSLCTNSFSFSVFSTQRTTQNAFCKRTSSVRLPVAVGSKQHSRVSMEPLKLALTDKENADQKRKLGSKDSSGPKKKKDKIHWTKPTLTIAIPALIGAMTDPVLSLIDTAFVGQLPNSSVPLAALGACPSIFHLAFNAFRATTTATTSLVSEAWSKEKIKQNIQDSDEDSPTRDVTVASIQFGLIAGFSIFTILLSCSSTILSLMGISSTSQAQK